MLYEFIKSLHIIFVVTWFAGLFYSVRLFVYFAEALEKPEPERSILVRQYQKMQKGLWYGITFPSMILTVILGSSLAVLLNYFAQPWMLAKLFFVFLLIIYHFICHSFFQQQQQGNGGKSAYFYRVWNELATVLLFVIVTLIVFKNALKEDVAVYSFSALSVLIFLAVYWAKQRRNQQNL